LRDPQSTPQTKSCQLSFEVEDSGIGMDSDQTARLFRPFEQGDNSTTRRFGGTGLGLAISRQLAYLMGGEVGAVSTPHVGSTFWFVCRFDVAERPVRQDTWDKNPEHAIAALRGKRVLVVDDNDFNQEVASDLLRDVNVDVALASHGAQALEILRGSHFDAVLMDVQMPVMDGHEATRHIRNDPAIAKTVVIAMTANAGTEDRERCLAAGMNEVLTKPIDPDLLFVTLARWTGMPQAEARAPEAMHLPADLPAASVEAPVIPAAVAGVEALPVWDANALKRIVGDNQATQTRLLDKYLLTAGETIASLRNAASASQWPQAGELAHKLKSSSRSVGAMRLGALCEALEREGRAGTPGACQALVALVIQGFSEVETRIRPRQG
jgi:CheY-like chemotaxis protein/HPt (histidine-containing phosphotransfer) domain-containing protein